jgi:hypothetical protein
VKLNEIKKDGIKTQKKVSKKKKKNR